MFFALPAPGICVSRLVVFAAFHRVLIRPVVERSVQESTTLKIETRLVE